jgi:hypothetical protein
MNGQRESRLAGSEAAPSKSTATDFDQLNVRAASRRFTQRRGEVV